MRHFEQETIAARYAAYRPQVQADIIDRIAQELRWRKDQPFGLAVDFACGTGHSSRPLLTYAERVIGCDVSENMLEQARRAHPEITFKRVDPDSHLPFTDASVDVLTVGFAFHWLDQPTFLREAARVVRPGGVLTIYNMYFPGVMKGNPRYVEWHHHVYIARYPTPTRHRRPLTEMLEQGDYSFKLEKQLPLSIPQTMSAPALRNYLTSQSNISAAVENGEPLEDIDAWLDTSLEPLFEHPIETFAYEGDVSLLRHT